jgi:2-polyprenyl-3-methyl-5-hydroxy-6-metoxy-1,4-benzoquinol methylase
MTSINVRPREVVKTAVRTVLPLFIRKRLAVWLHRQEGLAASRRSWWEHELLRDLAEKNINEYHKFLWSNHLSYAETYEVASRFGRENMKQSRLMFFSDLQKHLVSIAVKPADVRSAFEVGCSLGYQLRFLETDLFPSAAVLEGVDIDAYAIRSGAEYLTRIGSKVRLQCEDMERLEKILGEKRYDVIICTGVLMYLKEEDAQRVVAILMKHADKMVGFSGLAHPDMDNAQLGRSIPRESDQTFIHNIDSMVLQEGGRIAARRWEGGKLVDGHTIYFLFATTS